MKHLLAGILVWVIWGLCSCQSDGKVIIPSPIYVDNHYHGPADPEITWNPKTEEWMIFYTSRRPFKDQASYVGTPVGVAVSKDFVHWKFAGYCSFDGVGGQPDSEKTYWAPGVIVEGDSAHMFVTLKDDSTPVWGGPSNIVHFSAPLEDMISGWRRVNTVVDTPISIDATVVKNGDRWDMWYRDRPTEDTGGLYSLAYLLSCGQSLSNRHANPERLAGNRTYKIHDPLERRIQSAANLFWLVRCKSIV